MPIRIEEGGETRRKLACLCDDDWNLASQVDELDSRLREHGRRLQPGEYVADIGMIVRSDASGGGAVISTRMMKTMSELGMELWISEYRAG